MENKNISLLVAFLGLGCSILLFVFVTNIYASQNELKRQIMSLSSGENFGLPSGKIEQLESRLFRLEQSKSIVSPSTDTQKQFTYEEESLLKNIAQEKYVKQNSASVNGALRLQAKKSLIFSFDIPSLVSKEITQIDYLFTDDQNDAMKDVYLLYLSNENGAINLFSKGVSFYGSLGEFLDTENTKCSSSDIQVQSVAKIFKEHLIDELNFQKERLENVDFCKYITVHKEVKEVPFGGHSTLTAPHFVKDDPKYIPSVGYTLDTEKLYKDIQFSADTNGPTPRLFVTFSNSSQNTGDANGAMAISYRLLGIAWGPSFGFRDYNFLDQPKEYQTHIKTMLDSTLDSVMNTTVLLPSCEYGGCSY